MRSFGCFLPVFRPEKWKHRTSLPQSTEVCAQEVRCFRPGTLHFSCFSRRFFYFLPQYSKCSADVNFYIHCQIDSLRWQNVENSAKIRSRRDTMPCQNFWRFTGFFAGDWKGGNGQFQRECAIFRLSGYAASRTLTAEPILLKKSDFSWGKVPMFCIKNTDVCLKRSPMYLCAGKMVVGPCLAFPCGNVQWRRTKSL